MGVIYMLGADEPREFYEIGKSAYDEQAFTIGVRFVTVDDARHFVRRVWFDDGELPTDELAQYWEDVAIDLWLWGRGRLLFGSSDHSDDYHMAQETGSRYENSYTSQPGHWENRAALREEFKKALRAVQSDHE